MLGSTIPAGATYVNGSASGAVTPVTLAGTTVRALEWNIGGLPAAGNSGSQGSQTFHVQVQTALAVGLKLKGSIGIKGNDSIAVGKLPVIVVETPLALVPGPTAVSAMFTSGSTTAPGDTLTYTINYQNLSGATIDGVLLTCDIPKDTKYPASPKETKHSWPVFELGPYATGSATLAVNVNANAKNNALVKGMARLYAPNLSAEPKKTRVGAGLPDFSVVTQ